MQHTTYCGYHISGNKYFAIAIEVDNPANFDYFTIDPDVNNNAFIRAMGWAYPGPPCDGEDDVPEPIIVDTDKREGETMRQMPKVIHDDTQGSITLPTISRSDFDKKLVEIAGRSLTEDEVRRADKMADHGWTLRVVASNLFGDGLVDEFYKPHGENHVRLHKNLKPTEFNAGRPVFINGCLVEDDDEIEFSYYLKIALRRSDEHGDRWVISTGIGSRLLNKNQEWEWEPTPSNRTEEFVERTRFTTIQDAFDALEAWRTMATQKAIDEGIMTLKEQRNQD